MMPNFRRFLLVILLITLLLLPVEASAQDEITLDEVRVSLYPEWDRPEMLVWYHIKLAPGVALPATLAFSIPASVGAPHAVAERGVDGELYNVVYSREVHGDSALITFTAAMPEVVLEYYEPLVKNEDGLREFSYSWPGDYAVNDLVFDVQEPLTAENFTTNPLLGDGVLGRDGLRYYEASVGEIAQGGTYDLSLAYQNATDAISLAGPGMYPQPSQDITQETQGRVNLSYWLRWFAGLFALLLLGGGLFWLYRTRRTGQLEPASTGRGKRGSGAPSQEITVTDGPYCHQCGKKASSGDLFCRACGTRLRVG